MELIEPASLKQVNQFFLTSGFVYDTAEEAEKSFKEEKERFMYSRFGNPTVDTFQKRMAF